MSYSKADPEEVIEVPVPRSLSMKQYLILLFVLYYGAGVTMLYLIELGLAADSSTNQYAEQSLVWNWTYGENASYAEAMAPTEDGGFIVVGSTRAFGVEERETNPAKGDFYILRIDKNGEKVWERNYGGPDPDGANDVVEIPDGGYLVIGSTFSFERLDSDVVLFKLDEQGNMIWNRTYGNQSDGLRCIVQANDGGFLTAGNTRPPASTGHPFGIYMLRIDGNGDKLWETRMEGIGSTSICDMVEGNDGGYVLVAYTSSEGTYMLKINEEGKKIWEATYGGRGFSITPSDDDGYVLAGSIPNPPEPGDGNVYLFAVDNEGNRGWQAPLGAGETYCVTRCEDGFVAAGALNRLDHYGTDIYVVKTDQAGTPLWERTYRFSPGSSYVEEHATGIASAKGGVVVAGSMGGWGENIFVMKIATGKTTRIPDFPYYLLGVLLIAFVLICWRTRSLTMNT